MRAENMSGNNLIKVVFAGLMAALVCVSTSAFVIPLPTGGYANFGDCCVILSGYMLGPVYGALASGIGAGLSDLFLGYGIYAPFTFVIKAIMSVVVYYITKIASKRNFSSRVLFFAISALIAELIMIGGYFILEIFMYGVEGALPNIIGNAIQGAFGCFSSCFVYVLMEKTKVFKQTDRLLKNEQKHV